MKAKRSNKIVDNQSQRLHSKSRSINKKKNLDSPIKNKKKTTVRQLERVHTADLIASALEAIEKGSSFKQASVKFNVPKSTLHDKFRHKTPIVTRKGPETVLSAEEEKQIGEWIIFCQTRGFPVTKSLLLDLIEKYLIEAKKKTPFKKNRPGKWWYNAFLRRHPNIAVRVAQNLTSTRASVTESDLRKWFTHVENYLGVNNLLHIDPKRIFNLDESSFMLHPKESTVLAEKGSKSVYKIIGGNEKACLTVLFTAAASGDMPPPMILYSQKKSPRKDLVQASPEGWGIGHTERGWTDGPSFYSYIKNVFYPWLVKNNYDFPVILYVDNHSSHITLPLMKFWTDHQIEQA